MKNLAGNPTCDATIRTELTRCGLDVVEAPAPSGHEVNARCSGRLGPFTFRRAWIYWTVEGPVPIEVARAIHAHPVGRTDIRAGGHCGALPPDEYGATHYDREGRELMIVNDRERVSFNALVEKGSLPRDAMDRYHPVADLDARTAATARSIVDRYHIDTELGLYVFVQAVREHGLVPEWKNSALWVGHEAFGQACDARTPEAFLATLRTIVTDPKLHAFLLDRMIAGKGVDVRRRTPFAF